MIKAKRLILFVDIEKSMLLPGVESELMSVEQIVSVLDYARGVVEGAGMECVSVFELVSPDLTLITGPVTGSSTWRKHYSDAFEQKLKWADGIAVIEGLGEMSEVPEYIREIAQANFVIIAPFGRFFPSSTWDAKKELLRISLSSKINSFSRNHSMRQNRGARKRT